MLARKREPFLPVESVVPGGEVLAGRSSRESLRNDDGLATGLLHSLDHALCVENVLEFFRVVIGDCFVADFDPMLKTPSLVIDSEDNHEGRGFSEMRTLFLPR